MSVGVILMSSGWMTGLLLFISSSGTLALLLLVTGSPALLLVTGLAALLLVTTGGTSSSVA